MRGKMGLQLMSARQHIVSATVLLLVAYETESQEGAPATSEPARGTAPVAADWIITADDQRHLGNRDPSEIVRLITDRSRSAACTGPLEVSYGGLQWLAAECGRGTALHTLKLDPGPQSGVTMPFIFQISDTIIRPIVQKQPFEDAAADAYRAFHSLRQPELRELILNIRAASS